MRYEGSFDKEDVLVNFLTEGLFCGVFWTSLFVYLIIVFIKEIAITHD